MIEVTKENIHQYNLDDVILPILGHKVKMPSNSEIKSIFEKIMAEDNMDMDKFRSHAQNVLTSATGSYRKII